GKGSVRAINAIPGSPVTGFLIEERLLGSMSYQESSAPSSFDDFDYNFNFQVSLPGEDDPTRVATVPHKVEADRDHVFVLGGDPSNPTVGIWTSDLRQWDDGATAFEVRFAHQIVSRSMQAVDFYLDEAVDPQVVSNRVATVSYGEVSAMQDFEEGRYVVTITAADDPGDVLFTSPANSIGPRTSETVVAFDGDENDTSGLVVNMTNDLGIQRILPDANSVPTVQFLHASLPLPGVDVYDDDTLTNRIVSGLAHGESSAELPASGDAQEYFWTPENSTATILFQAPYQAPAGSRTVISVVGPTDQWVYSDALPDRAPVSLYAKLLFYQTALDNALVDVYLLPADDTIEDDDNPIAGVLPTPSLTPPIPVQAGAYDLFLTPAGERTTLAGPVRIDVVNGDVVEMVILDTADPAVAELKPFPAP
ncbi:MAG: DUF4397 domain-containing protein, partial [Proteobacteria bacterium]|nr:DUF4397 domain-containing protein [Pseudomonadota bacterium]